MNKLAHTHGYVSIEILKECRNGWYNGQIPDSALGLVLEILLTMGTFATERVLMLTGLADPASLLAASLDIDKKRFILEMLKWGEGLYNFACQRYANSIFCFVLQLHPLVDIPPKYVEFQPAGPDFSV